MVCRRNFAAAISAMRSLNSRSNALMRRICASSRSARSSARTCGNGDNANDAPLLPAHSLEGLLVLEADLVDQLGVERDLLVHLDGPRTRVGLRVVDGDLHFQSAVVRPTEPFGHLRGVGHRAPGHVEPEPVAEADGLNDE